MTPLPLLLPLTLTLLLTLTVRTTAACPCKRDTLIEQSLDSDDVPLVLRATVVFTGNITTEFKRRPPVTRNIYMLNVTEVYKGCAPRYLRVDSLQQDPADPSCDYPLSNSTEYILSLQEYHLPKSKDTVPYVTSCRYNMKWDKAGNDLRMKLLPGLIKEKKSCRPTPKPEAQPYHW